MTVALQVDDLRARVGGVLVLDGVSFDVARGAWCAVVGPNGAGKTTLLRSITGAVGAQGRITAYGRDLKDMSTKERARLVAYAPQLPDVQPEMTVQTYVGLGRAPYWSRFGARTSTDTELVDDVLVRLDLHALHDRRMSSLSGGERQRAVLAQAVAQQAPLLLLDEPTTSLDIGHQQHFLELLDGLRRTHDLTVITSLHDLNVAGQYADQVVLLQNQAAPSSGTPAEVLNAAAISDAYGVDVAITNESGRVSMQFKRPVRP